MPSESILENISIASPCNADWETMQGTDRIRFCAECRLNVYNLSAMQREEAEMLVREKEGRLCIRFFQRPDGTILTQDCPVGLRALHRLKLRRIGGMAAAATLVTVAGAFQVCLAPGTADAKPALMGDMAEPASKMGEMTQPAPVMGTPVPLPPTLQTPCPTPKDPNQIKAIPEAPQPLMGKPAIQTPPPLEQPLPPEPSTSQ